MGDSSSLGLIRSLLLTLAGRMPNQLPQPTDAAHVGILLAIAGALKILSPPAMLGCERNYIGKQVLAHREPGNHDKSMTHKAAVHCNGLDVPGDNALSGFKL